MATADAGGPCICAREFDDGSRTFGREVPCRGLVLSAAAGCGRSDGAGELHARLSTLEREAEGLRVSVAKLERGEPILPEEAVVVSVSEAVIKAFLDAQLPFEAEAGSFRIKLTQGEARFRGSPSVHLRGSITPVDHPNLVGEVQAQGALEDLRVDADSGTLRATIAVDHVDLVQMGGLEGWIPNGSLNELARTVRKQIEGRLPVVQIPVKIEQGIDLPSVTKGPVRIRGAKMPLEVGVADVYAGRGILWVAIGVVPGEFVRERFGAEDRSEERQAEEGGQVMRRRIVVGGAVVLALLSLSGQRWPSRGAGGRGRRAPTRCARRSRLSSRRSPS